jgi:hypothetical protein
MAAASASVQVIAVAILDYQAVAASKMLPRD